IPDYRECRLSVFSADFLHDRSTLLLHAPDAFTNVTDGQIDQPDGRQSGVHPASMTDTSRRLSIGIQHAVIRIVLVSISHAHILERPTDDRAVEITRRGGVGDRQIKPRDTPDAALSG